jgi:hypothetical protein
MDILKSNTKSHVAPKFPRQMSYFFERNKQSRDLGLGIAQLKLRPSIFENSGLFAIYKL